MVWLFVPGRGAVAVSRVEFSFEEEENKVCRGQTCANAVVFPTEGSPGVSTPRSARAGEGCGGPGTLCPVRGVKRRWRAARRCPAHAGLGPSEPTREFKTGFCLQEPFPRRAVAGRCDAGSLRAAVPLSARCARPQPSPRRWIFSAWLGSGAVSGTSPGQRCPRPTPSSPGEVLGRAGAGLGGQRPRREDASQAG